MPQAAKVRSIEAIDAFRIALRLYRERASRVLDDVHDDVVRTRTWLETDRKLHWRKLIRDREARLVQAQAEMLTARLSDNSAAIQDRRLAVNRARAALSEAQAGLERVQRWLRQYEAEIESRIKPLLQLRNTLDHDLLKGLAFLEGIVTTLDAYAAVAPPTTSTPSPSPQPNPEPSPAGASPA